jgi:hypothetical protein
MEVAVKVVPGCTAEDSPEGLWPDGPLVTLKSKLEKELVLPLPTAESRVGTCPRDAAGTLNAARADMPRARVRRFASAGKTGSMPTSVMKGK